MKVEYGQISTAHARYGSHRRVLARVPRRRVEHSGSGHVCLWRSDSGLLGARFDCNSTGRCLRRTSYEFCRGRTFGQRLRLSLQRSYGLRCCQVGSANPGACNTRLGRPIHDRFNTVHITRGSIGLKEPFFPWLTRVFVPTLGTLGGSLCFPLFQYLRPHS